MSTKALVSVIIIFLNTERFLQEAIESVLAQTYDAWELLLVDDGSTDGSTTIARQYADQFPDRVRYLEHPEHMNCGMSATRNLGIRHASGAYIAFLDSDDVWFPNALADQISILEARPDLAMVYGPTQWWYSWTGKPEDRQRDFIDDLSIRTNARYDPPGLLNLVLQGRAAGTSAIVVRKTVVDGVDGYEEQFRSLYEDQAFFVKVCLEEAVFVADQCWYRYRQHPDSSCAVAEQSGREYAARLTFLNWVAEYVEDQDIKSRTISRSLRIALWPYQHPISYPLLERAQQLGGTFYERFTRVADAICALYYRIPA
jgi:glycosyltransferase involved in cell wall biosynthesis